LKQKRRVDGKKGNCGIVCSLCDYFPEPCSGCFITKACLVDYCIKGMSYTGITRPHAFCLLRSYCHIGGRGRPAPEHVPPIRPKSKATVSLPGFIPIVSIADRRSWFWSDVQLPMIIVRLAELIVRSNLLSEVSGKGLHDYLGFDGRIVLSTIMPDELIDELQPKDYPRFIRDLKPDATMVPDNYTYMDDPLYLSWSQTIRLVRNALSFLELDIPAIGLIKGATPEQVGWSTKQLVDMGYGTFALPARELSRSDLLDNILAPALLVFEEYKLDTNLLIYGRSYPVRGLKKASYANHSWFLGAKGGTYFKGGFQYDITDPSIRFERCNCESCKGRMAQDLAGDLRALALHNLLDLDRALGDS